MYINRTQTYNGLQKYKPKIGHQYSCVDPKLRHHQKNLTGLSWTIQNAHQFSKEGHHWKCSLACNLDAKAYRHQKKNFWGPSFKMKLTSTRRSTSQGTCNVKDVHGYNSTPSDQHIHNTCKKHTVATQTDSQIGHQTARPGPVRIEYQKPKDKLSDGSNKVHFGVRSLPVTTTIKPSSWKMEEQ